MSHIPHRQGSLSRKDHKEVLFLYLLYLGNHNKTNQPISSNNHPSATANKATHSLKIGGFTKSTVTSYHFDTV